MSGRRAITGFAILALLLIVECAGTKLFKQPETIKPLDAYADPVLKDVAQMLYPGFLEIRDEFQQQFGEGHLELMQYSLQVKELPEQSGISSGYYVNLTSRIQSGLPQNEPYLSQAEYITEQYLHNVLMVLSRDWNNIFSPSMAGVDIQFYWGSRDTTSTDAIQYILQNQDVQNYLNARMTIQELIDKNFVEGTEQGKSLGRIELNGLGVEQL